MAELNLKQIIDRLNTKFTGDTRNLVFWYDDNGELLAKHCFANWSLSYQLMYRFRRDINNWISRFIVFAA